MTTYFSLHFIRFFFLSLSSNRFFKRAAYKLKQSTSVECAMFVNAHCHCNEAFRYANLAEITAGRSTFCRQNEEQIFFFLQNVANQC